MKRQCITTPLWLTVCWLLAGFLPTHADTLNHRLVIDPRVITAPSHIPITSTHFPPDRIPQAFTTFTATCPGTAELASNGAWRSGVRYTFERPAIFAIQGKPRYLMCWYKSPVGGEAFLTGYEQVQGGYTCTLAGGAITCKKSVFTNTGSPPRLPPLVQPVSPDNNVAAHADFTAICPGTAKLAADGPWHSGVTYAFDKPEVYVYQGKPQHLRCWYKTKNPLGGVAFLAGYNQVRDGYACTLSGNNAIACHYNGNSGSSPPPPATAVGSTFPYTYTRNGSATSYNTNAIIYKTPDIQPTTNRPLIVMMPGWGGNGDVAAQEPSATARQLADEGYIIASIGFKQAGAAWSSDIADSAKGFLQAFYAANPQTNRIAILWGTSYSGLQDKKVIHYLRQQGLPVRGFLSADAGYSTADYQTPIYADTTQYSAAMVQNLGDTTVNPNICESWGDCGARERAIFHRNRGDAHVYSRCFPGGNHGARPAGWNQWTQDAIKKMVHGDWGYPAWAGETPASQVVTNSCQ